MFIPHTSQIDIKRDEPVDLDVDAAQALVRREFSDVAAKCVLSDLFKSRKRPGAEKKIRKAWEKDLRADGVKPFLAVWNKYRRDYLGREIDWEPKNVGQISCIEKILDNCKEHEIQLEVLLLCSFKAFKFKRHTLTVQDVLAYGLDHYNKFSAEVEAAIAEDSSYYRSYGFD